MSTFAEKCLWSARNMPGDSNRSVVQGGFSCVLIFYEQNRKKYIISPTFNVVYTRGS